MKNKPIKLFVGCSPNGEDAESLMVLEYTARKHCSRDIDIEWMMISKDPNSFWTGWNTSEWSTPFSGFRWGIPEFCDFRGQAIYMDSDMIIQTDLTDLWNIPWWDGPIVMNKGGWRFCVCKWNCESAKEHILPIARLKYLVNSHPRMFNKFEQEPELSQVFDRQWNNFDGENDKLEDIKILHYTDMSTQPHLKYALPRLKEMKINHWYDGQIREHRRKDVQELFDKVYNEALSAGYKVENYIPKELYGSYDKRTQVDYVSSNGFDVTKGQ